MPDLEPFVSPVDGSVISGRAALREHDKRHGVTNVADFKGQWQKQASDRAKLFTPGSGYDRERRVETIKRAYEEVRNKRR